MQIAPPPRFCHVSKFHAPDCLHYNAVMQQKAYQPHYSNRVFTIFQKYIFNVHQITTSGGKFNIFSGKDTDKKYRLKCTKTQNTPFQVKNLIFFWPPPQILPPVGRGTPSPHPLLTSGLDPACVPQNSSQIFANASSSIGLRLEKLATAVIVSSYCS